MKTRTRQRTQACWLALQFTSLRRLHYLTSNRRVAGVTRPNFLDAFNGRCLGVPTIPHRAPIDRLDQVLSGQIEEASPHRLTYYTHNPGRNLSPKNARNPLLEKQNHFVPERSPGNSPGVIYPLDSVNQSERLCMLSGKVRVRARN